MAMIESIRAEYLRYKSLGEKTIAQLDGAALSAPPAGGGNSIATICWHVSGNFRSRFTDFLTTDADLDRTVTIRNQGLSVCEALLRSLAHASYHVGQIVYAAKAALGPEWRYLSIPPGESDRYNLQPTLDRPPTR